MERPWDNPEGRLTSEMTALVGLRVAGEHYHNRGQDKLMAGARLLDQWLGRGARMRWISSIHTRPSRDH